ncbi:hypothetical protein HN011_006600 [Eciton burchellii]|nr:hypothetical protein HN011_006600 [Eciton burchellii]
MFPNCARPPILDSELVHPKGSLLKRMECINYNNKPVPKSNALKVLNPMLGGDSLFRLGGRLRNGALEYCKKPSVILPRYRISELLIDRAHRAILHGGTQLTLCKTKILDYRSQSRQGRLSINM